MKNVVNFHKLFEGNLLQNLEKLAESKIVYIFVTFRVEKWIII
jgi:hypothetical protein